MTDLINGRATAAISFLVEVGNKIRDGLKSDNPQVREMAKIADGLTDVADCLSRQMEWISVEERLPEMYEDGSADIVLVTDGQFIHMAAYSNEKWYFAECGEMKEPMFYKVTHWMPLPEPPKEENV